MNKNQLDYLLNNYKTRSVKQLAEDLNLGRKEVQRELRKVLFEREASKTPTAEKNSRPDGSSLAGQKKSQPNPPVKLSEGIFLLLATAIAACLILANLGNSYLWSDEAHTVLLGKTILRHGIPKGTDGLNSFSVDSSGNNSDVDKNGTWILTPWLPYYLIAPFTTLSPQGREGLLRLPFALFGIATVSLLFLVSKRFFNRSVAFASVCFLILCVPFLLYSRQCRYYALAMFFSTWLTLAYDKFLKGEKGFFWQLFLSQLLLFHTHYMIWAGMILGFSIHFLLVSFDKERFREGSFLAIIAATFNLPWILMFAAKATHDISPPGKYFENLRGFLIGFNNHLIPYAFVLIFLAFMCWAKRKFIPFAWRDLKLSIPLNRGFLMVILIVIGMAISSLSTGYFFRYLVGVIPLAVSLQALSVIKIWDQQKWLGALLALLLLFSNVLAFPFERTFKLSTWDVAHKPWLRFPFFDYLYELTHEYKGPVRGLVDYLREHAKEGDRIFIAYGDLPLKYYFPKLRILGGLTGEDLRKERAEEAEWIIPRHYTMESVRPINDYIKNHVQLESYRSVEINYPDYTFENIPEPEMHLFRTAQNKPKVMILQRIRP